MIKMYVRDENRNPVGVVVALGPSQYGWSFCHSPTANNKGDKWDRFIGVDLAVDRAKSGLTSFVPYKYRDAFKYTLGTVAIRAYKVFKNA